MLTNYCKNENHRDLVFKLMMILHINYYILLSPAAFIK